MGIRTRVLGIVCLLAVLPACDAEQPQTVSAQLAQVQFRTIASTNVYDVWERYVDADQDGLPDQFDPQGMPIDPPIQVQCRQVFDQNGNPVRNEGESVPYPHSVEILVLRAGETEPERLTTLEALGETFNLTPYDTRSAGSQPNPPCTPPEVCVRLGRLGAGNRLVMESRYQDQGREVISTPNGDIFPFRCPGSPGLGDPRLDGTLEDPGTPPFSVELEKGDTIIVRARKASTPLNDLELTSRERLSATLTVGGLRVDPAGESATSVEPGSGLSFSYTLQ